MTLVAIDAVNAVEIVCQVAVVRHLSILVNRTGPIASRMDTKTAQQLLMYAAFVRSVNFPIEFIKIDKLFCVKQLAHRLRFKSWVNELLISMETGSHRRSWNFVSLA